MGVEWKQFDCQRCRNEGRNYCGKGYKESLGPPPETRQCSAPKELIEAFGVPKDNPVRFDKCPVKMRPDWWAPLLGLYRHYQKGLFLRHGGVVRQPAPYPFLMQAIENASNYFEGKKIEESK